MKNVHLAIAAAFGVLASSAPAQARAQWRALDPPRSVTRASAGLVRAGGQLVGIGADYKVAFDGRGLTFVPALGDRVPQNQTLRFELRSFGRRDAEPRAGGGEVHPDVDGLTVRYRRPGVEETYAMRPDGVKQSFTFAALPQGTGDLVVRGRLSGELLPHLRAASADEVRFEIDGAGGVRIGDVVGIDAAGRRAAGALRFADGELEMSLPADFVDRAVLPLVLDPLIGTAFLAGSGFDDDDPDVAYDVTRDVYLVVWHRWFSSTNVDIRAQRVDPAGALVGNVIGVTISSSSVNVSPRVANVSLRDAFAIVWTRNGAIMADAVDAGTGATRGNVAIAGAPDVHAYPDIAGFAAGSDDEAVVVWANVTQGTIQAAQINVPASGAPSGFDYTAITGPSGSFDDTRPAISRDGGATALYLVAWERSYLSGSSQGDIRGSIVSSNLTVVHGGFAIAVLSKDQRDPAVDGDGERWVVAWESAVTAGDADIHCLGVVWDQVAGTSYLSPFETVVEADPGVNEIDPTVGWLGESVLIGFSEQAGIDYDTTVKSIDPFTCLACEGEFALSTAGTTDYFVRIATQKSGGGTGEEALVVWSQSSRFTGDGDVMAQVFRAGDGVVTNLGGGCGSGGTALSTCAVTGNAGYTMRLEANGTVMGAWLVLSPASLVAGCGSQLCKVIADPFQAFVFAFPGSGQEYSTTVAIPVHASMAGRSFYMQWWVAPPFLSGSCNFLDTSDALRITIQ